MHRLRYHGAWEIGLERIGARRACEGYSIASGYETVLLNPHFLSPGTADAAAAVGVALQS